VDPPSYDLVDRAIEDLGRYQTILLTSANAVDGFFRRLRFLGRDSRALSGQEVIAIGPSTAKRLEHFGVCADGIPDDSRAEGLLAFLQGQGGLKDRRFLLPRAEHARELLPESIRDAGGQIDVVPVYTNRPPDKSARKRLIRSLERGDIDVVTFTSSSTVSHLVDLLGKERALALLAPTAVACIGPVTAATARSVGLKVTIEATEQTTEGLLSALCVWAAARRVAGGGAG